jgi:hypothetical protein
MAVFSPLFLSQPSLNTPKMTVKSLAVLNKSYKMRDPSEMKKEQTRLFRQLPSGLNMEVIEQKGLVFADKKIIETQEAVKTHLWFLFMEVTMLLGAGQSTGCLSFQGLVLIAMLLACWVRSVSFLSLSHKCLIFEFLVFQLLL